ncbi:hypothetical protein KKE60_05560 [Patescibacteria group bacterium]|nr:hypothetical protein [Patescibacteria group bacterium]
MTRREIEQKLAGLWDEMGECEAVEYEDGVTQGELEEAEHRLNELMRESERLDAQLLVLTAEETE